MQHVTSQLISKRAELKGEIVKSGDSILNYYKAKNTTKRYKSRNTK